MTVKSTNPAQSASYASSAPAGMASTSAPAAQPADQGKASAGAETSITDKVASARQAGSASNASSGSEGDAARVDVAKIMAAYAQQFASSPMQNLKQIL
ncbi:MAG: hypothetical protein AB3N06_08380 [Erythrobacter sp.]